MTRQVLSVTLVGTSPLLMHSGSLLDPIHPVARELAAYHGREAMSTSDHAHIGDLEFAGSLWLSDDRPCVPARTLQAALREAADRRGLDRRVRQSLFVDLDAALDYEGPDDLEALKRDAAFRLRSLVTVDGRRRPCTRPRFERWAVASALSYDDRVIGRSDVIDLAIFAGDDVGIGAGRPRYGRFAVVPTAA